MQPAGDMTPLETRAEILRVARLCAPCMDSIGTLTFRGDPTQPAALSRWRDTVWNPWISPALNQARAAMQRGSRELIEVDRQLDNALAGPLAKASRAAGRQLAAAFQAPASEPALAKFLEAVRQGRSPGHFCVVFAARAPVFHIPPPIAEAALLLLEMHAAPIDCLWTVIGECLLKSNDAKPAFEAA